MAKADQIPTDLTLEIGVDLSPEAFMSAARHFFGLAKEIALSTGEDEVVWRVKVKEGSNLIALEPDQLSASDHIEAIYDKFNVGTSALMRGEIEKADLSEGALDHFKKLAQLTESKKNPVTMKFWVQKSPLDMGPRIAETIREDWRSSYSDYGTIDGRLLAIQERGGSLKIKIKDPLFARPIECSLPEEMIDEALSTFRKRVEIAGLIKYRKNGMPVSIAVDRITIMADDDELPTANDVRGIFAAG